MATSETVSSFGLVNPTNAEMLVQVNHAISAILLGAQSYTIGSRKITRADLSQLYKMRQDLEAQAIADEGNNSFFDDCYVAVWPWER